MVCLKKKRGGGIGAQYELREDGYILLSLGVCDLLACHDGVFSEYLHCIYLSIILLTHLHNLYNNISKRKIGAQ